MYLEKVYIRYSGGKIITPSTFAAMDGFESLGVEVVPFHSNAAVADLSDLSPTVGIVGYVSDILHALKIAGKENPPNIDYPEELRPWLGRNVWRSTLGEIRKTFDPIFIKPVIEKLFTGFVWRESSDLSHQVVICKDDVEIWVSDRVRFISEYRVFIKDGIILGARLYKGDWSKAPDKEVVTSAVDAFVNAPRGYSLDFGVTEDNQTLLVEVNDGYALANYGLESVPYANLLEARWEELFR